MHVPPKMGWPMQQPAVGRSGWLFPQGLTGGGPVRVVQPELHLEDGEVEGGAEEDKGQREGFLPDGQGGLLKVHLLWRGHLQQQRPGLPAVKWPITALHEADHDCCSSDHLRGTHVTGMPELCTCSACNNLAMSCLQSAIISWC